MVCEKVQFTFNSEDDAPKILLPWTPAVYQEMELIVTGGQLPSYGSRELFFSSLKTHVDLTFVHFNVGCAKASSDYKWFTSDMSILSVSAYGIIQAKRPGIATVKVVSTFDSQNFDEVQLHLLIIQREKIYSFYIQREMGQNGQTFSCDLSSMVLLFIMVLEMIILFFVGYC